MKNMKLTSYREDCKRKMVGRTSKRTDDITPMYTRFSRDFSVVPERIGWISCAIFFRRFLRFFQFIFAQLLKIGWKKFKFFNISNQFSVIKYLYQPFKYIRNCQNTHRIVYKACKNDVSTVYLFDTSADQHENFIWNTNFTTSSQIYHIFRFSNANLGCKKYRCDPLNKLD